MECHHCHVCVFHCLHWYGLGVSCVCLCSLSHLCFSLFMLVRVICILQSCKHESWINIAKFLMDDVPLLLKSEDAKDIHQVISIIVASLPSNFEEFIKWIAEIRRREDGGPSLSAEEKARLAIKV